VITELMRPWGLLPLAVPLVLIAANRTAWLVLRKGSRVERLAGSAVLAMGLVHASVGVLGTFGVLSTNTLLAVFACLAVGSVALTTEAPSDAWWNTRQQLWPAMLLAVPVVLITVAAARLLPIWQWDAIGYHLPFVNFVIQSGGFANVPPDVRYISTYPHDIELGMVALRLMLPDDRLVDLGQLPYGIAGACLTAALARALGANTRLAALAGATWLTLPCVFLQLPTNYVDVGTAAAFLGAIFFLVTSPPSWRTMLLGGLSLGLFLGSKPSAPIAAVALGTLALVRCFRAKQLPAFALLAVVAAVFGAEMYLVMFARHGNPVWPVAVNLGPFTLPGLHHVDELLAAGAALPSASGPLLQRLFVSWVAVTTPPVFDMKMGGLGLPFLVALPFAIGALVRRREPLVLGAFAISLLSPDPSMARYVLAFGALVLVLAATQLSSFQRGRKWALAVLVGVGIVQLTLSWPGLTGDGPGLQTYWALNDDGRRVAVGPHGTPTDYPPLWGAVLPGESIAFDDDFEFPGLLWSPQLTYPVHALPPAADATFLDTHRVRVLAVGPQNRHLVPSEQWRMRFSCRSADCAVFERIDPRIAER
jgi:hypothetical protein